MAWAQCCSRGGKAGGQVESGDDVRSHSVFADVQKSVGRVTSPGGLCEETRRFRKTPASESRAREDARERARGAIGQASPSNRRILNPTRTS